MWLRCTSWNLAWTRRPRKRDRIRCCFARSTSGSSIGSHWNGVCGFGTKDDTATFTASAALDPSTPRFLRIAGDQLSARELTAVVSEVTGKEFRLFRAGGLGMLGALIKVARTVAPGEKEIYPAWQGMQYMRNMFDGRAMLQPLDNDRYPGMRWTTVRDVLTEFLGAS